MLQNPDLACKRTIYRSNGVLYTHERVLKRTGFFSISDLCCICVLQYLQFYSSFMVKLLIFNVFINYQWIQIHETLPQMPSVWWAASVCLLMCFIIYNLSINVLFLVSGLIMVNIIFFISFFFVFFVIY